MKIKNLDKTIDNLKQIRSTLLQEVEKVFIEDSLRWIAKQAERNLNRRTNGYNSSDARDWNFTYNPSTHTGKLENNDPNSAAIEFGIGRYAKNHPAKNVQVAQSEGYQFDVPSEHKDDQGRWVFYDEKTGLLIGFRIVIDDKGKKKRERYFSGYKGKSFLFDAFSSYHSKQIWVQKYNKAFDKVMSKHFKKV